MKKKMNNKILNLISKWLKKHNINPMVLVTDEDLKEYKKNKRKQYMKDFRNREDYKEMRKKWDKKYVEKKRGVKNETINN